MHVFLGRVGAAAFPGDECLEVGDVDRVVLGPAAEEEDVSSAQLGLEVR